MCESVVKSMVVDVAQQCICLQPFISVVVDEYAKLLEVYTRAFFLHILSRVLLSLLVSLFQLLRKAVMLLGGGEIVGSVLYNLTLTQFHTL